MTTDLATCPPGHDPASGPDDDARAGPGPRSVRRRVTVLARTFAARARALAGSRRAVAGLVLLAVLVALAFAGPLCLRWAWDDTDFTAFGEGPSSEHWLGTTQSGHDVLALTLRGTRRSLMIGMSAAILSTCLAAVVGTAAGFAGGRLDRALMWGADLLLVLPSFLLVAVLAPRLGGSGAALVPLLAAALWPITARVVRAATVSLREREYVLAARLLGVGGPRTVVRHVLPHLSSLLVADVSVNAGVAVVTEGGLSYLGFGARPPDASLGTLLAGGGAGAAGFPWPIPLAAALLVLLVVAVNLLGDGLRDLLDPAARPHRRGAGP